jgi:hypothetical protein
MPDNSIQTSALRAERSGAAGSWYRREPGLATLFLGLIVMILAFLFPPEQRTLAFYPAVAFIVVGTLMTLRHGPDRPKDPSS